MHTTISPDDRVMTLINVFHVEPDRCDDLVRLLVDATQETMRHLDGFVSANIHRSADRTRVVNYAQWSSREAFAAMQGDERAGGHMREAAALATSFDPMVCEVVDTISASGG